eukprot:7446702-Prorocentrum_lima.AAC.1
MPPCLAASAAAALSRLIPRFFPLLPTLILLAFQQRCPWFLVVQSLLKFRVLWRCTPWTLVAPSQ